MADGWRWDPSLYSGAAPHYRRGRLPYPTELADVVARELALGDGQDRSPARLLDLGCGPGSLTLVLADRFAQAVGLDADPGMLAEAAAEARRRGIANARWVQRRAEELDPATGPFAVVTLAQSFHWMDQPAVARLIGAALGPTGAVVHVGATTHRGVDDPGELPGPTPPWARIDELVATYLGTRRRAGQGTRPWLTDTPPKPRPEDLALAGAGLVGPHRVPVGGGEVVARPAEEIVDAVHSLSYAAPHLFGDRLAAFDADLRTLLGPGPLFERRREIELSFWRKG